MLTPPGVTAPARLARRLHVGPVLHEAALIAFAALVYFGVRNLTAGAAPDAFENARRIARLEAWLQVDWERGLQDLTVSSDAWITLANWVYIWGHWPTIAVFAVFLYRRHRPRYLLLRNAMFISGAIGFLFFALLPVAPPRLVDPALMDTVTLHSDSYRALQPPGLTNQYAAFPSLHFGWNLLLGIVLWGTATLPVLRVLAVVGPLAMGAAVVLTANHWVLDLAGGTAVVVVGYAIARRGLAGSLR